MFIGYHDSKGYKLINPRNHKITDSKNVVFFENSMYFKTENYINNNINDSADNNVSNLNHLFFPWIDEIIDNSSISDNYQDLDNDIMNTDSDTDTDASESNQEIDGATMPQLPQCEYATDSNIHQKLSRPKRKTKLPNKFKDFVMYAANNTDEEDPSSVQEAFNSKYQAEWKKAMDNEVQSLSNINTWGVTVLPEGGDAIDIRWLFKIKRNAEGKIDRFKARLVAKAFMQRPGIGIMKLTRLQLKTAV